MPNNARPIRKRCTSPAARALLDLMQPKAPSGPSPYEQRVPLYVCIDQECARRVRQMKLGSA